MLTNDNRTDDPAQAAELAAVGLAPADTHESALLAHLSPGDYTAVGAGKDGGMGVGLVQVHTLK